MSLKNIIANQRRWANPDYKKRVGQKISLTLTGRHATKEAKLKMSKARKGKPFTEEHKKHLSESEKGRLSPMKGIHLSEEIKKKISESKKGKKRPSFSKEWKEHLGESRLGSKNWNWKGGKQLSWARQDAKRRQLDFNPWNKPFKDCEAHHLDKENIIYIPKEMHESVFHNLWVGLNMDTINDLAISYLEETLS